MRRRALPLAVAAWLCAACAPFPAPMGGTVPETVCAETSPVTHSIFLVGDAGKPSLPVDPVLASLRGHVEESASALGADRVAVVYLGDNVYPRGLTPEDHRDARSRRHGERVLDAQIDAAGPARAIFTAGNHDWHMESDEGWAWVRAQQRYLDTRSPRVSMLPPGGCAGPSVVDFGPFLRFVFIDQVGWYHTLRHPAEHRALCRHQTAVEIFLALQDEFDNPEGHHVVLAMHHPLLTAGPHGGYYTWKQHLFPLRDFVPWLWLPLPVIGSIYPVARLLGITGTDVSSETYRRFVTAIYRTSTPRAPIAIAAGHEHGLQVHRDALGLYYLVSGAGSRSKVNRVDAERETVQMAVASPGYMRLDVRGDGSLGVTVFALQGRGPARAIYRHCLAHGPPREPALR